MPLTPQEQAFRYNRIKGRVAETLIQELETLVNSILAARTKNAAVDTSAFEQQIDELVYGLYGLTEEEIRIVENS